MLPQFWGVVLLLQSMSVLSTVVLGELNCNGGAVLLQSRSDTAVKVNGQLNSQSSS